MPAFKNLEEKDYKKNLSRIEEALNSELNHLQHLCNDWANWDDSYNFMMGKNSGFVKTNIAPTTFTAADLNKIYFLDNSGNVFFGKNYDKKSETFIDFSSFEKNDYFKTGDFYEKFLSRETVRFISGVFSVDDGVFFFVAHRVYETGGDGFSPGILIFCRQIDTDLISNIRERVKLQYDVIFNKTLNLSDYYDKLESTHVSEEDDIVKITFKENMHLYKPYYDVNGTVAFYNKMIYPSDIIRQGLDTIYAAVVALALAGLLIMIMYIVLMRKIVIEPIKKMTAHIMTLERDGDYSRRIKIDRDDELGILSKSIDYFTLKIYQQTMLLEEMAIKDGLTRIYNRRYFDKHFEMEWNRHCRKNQSLALFILDVDYFKRYNDFYGHQMGDAVLSSIGRLLKNFTGRSGEFSARYGGEEFVVVLPETSYDSAFDLADKLNREILDLNIPHEKAVETGGKVTVSIGVIVGVPAISHDSSNNQHRELSAKLREDFIKLADSALYKAKENGRNRKEIISLEEVRK